MLRFYVFFLAALVQGNLLCEKAATLQPATAMLTCDGAMTVYVDGVRINNKTANFETAQNSTIPVGSSVLAIYCHRLSQPPKILGSINTSILTNSKGWVCTNQYHSAWNAPGFVDASWAPAVVYGKNNNSTIPYGKVDNISNTAEWIGTKNHTADSLYCRLFLCPPNACVTIRTSRIDNHRLMHSTFDTIPVKNVGECALKCHAAYNRCQSFNYNSSTGNCELNSSSGLLGSKDVIPAPGVTYFYRTN